MAADFVRGEDGRVLKVAEDATYEWKGAFRSGPFTAMCSRCNCCGYMVLDETADADRILAEWMESHDKQCDANGKRIS